MDFSILDSLETAISPSNEIRSASAIAFFIIVFEYYYLK